MHLKQHWPSIRAAYHLYIGGADTETILLQPVRESVADAYARIERFIVAHMSEEQLQIVAMPSREQIWQVLNA